MDVQWFSDWPEAMATHDDPTSKGLHFYTEAQTLLSKEEGQVSLANVQGLGALYTRYHCYASRSDRDLT